MDDRPVDRAFLKMRTDPSMAAVWVCCMLSPFPVIITPIGARYFVIKDFSPKVPVITTVGITLVFVFHIRDISNARSGYFDIFWLSVLVLESSCCLFTKKTIWLRSVTVYYYFLL